MPLSNLAWDYNGYCNIFVRHNDGTEVSNTNYIILGNMFLQQYLAWFDYDFSITAPTSTLSLQMSDLNTISGCYLGNADMTIGPDPFTPASDDSSGISEWMIVKISCGGVFLLIILIAVGFFVKSKCSKTDKEANDIVYSSTTNGNDDVKLLQEA